MPATGKVACKEWRLTVRSKSSCRFKALLSSDRLMICKCHRVSPINDTASYMGVRVMIASQIVTHKNDKSVNGAK